MEDTMLRTVKNISVSLTASEATTPVITKSDKAGGVVHIPAGSSITSITYYAYQESTGTFNALYEEVGDGTTRACTRTLLAASRSYEMPSCVYACPFIKLVVNAAGDVVVSLMS